MVRIAGAERIRGVDFAGIGSICIAVLVLLTLGAVVRGRQKLWFSGSGVALGGTALVLFLVTLVTGGLRLPVLVPPQPVTLDLVLMLLSHPVTVTGARPASRWHWAHQLEAAGWRSAQPA